MSLTSLPPLPLSTQEFLYNDSKAKEIEALSSVLSSVPANRLSSKGSGHGAAMPDISSINFLNTALESYAKSISVGHEFLTQSLPRMLTLFFHITMPIERYFLTSSSASSSSSSSSTSSSASSVSSSSLAYYKQAFQEAQLRANSTMKHYSSLISAASWYTGVPQLVSRTVKFEI
jgi:hypothetical protein